jgi:hypothetical protein
MIKHFWKRNKTLSLLRISEMVVGGRRVEMQNNMGTAGYITQ